MKNFFKSQKGVNLISLSIAVIMILIITNVILYNVKNNLGVEKLQNMQADIENLRDKISIFYAQNGKIPASIEYTNIGNIEKAGLISTEIDTGKFYVIDLSAIDNLTLNYGKDYQKIKSGEATTIEQINNLEDLYIINETSHNIFLVKGIKYDNELFYTDYTSEDVDTKAVNLIDTNSIEGWSPTYDKTAIYKDGNGDTATIPEGFQVSRKIGETIIDTGLVVRGPDESEFVWVPVEDINSMAQCETAGGDCRLVLDAEGVLKCTNPDHASTAGNIVGKLYSTDYTDIFGTVNTTYNANSKLREPAIITGNNTGTGTNWDADTTNKYYEKAGYDSTTDMLESLKAEYKIMAESIAKNGGFYVGRYETSLSDATESSPGSTGVVQSKKDVIPTSANNTATSMWYGLYKAQKGLTNTHYGSSMIWGSQYDALINWVKNGTGDDKDKITITGIGNNSGGKVITTGNSSYSNDTFNNIRDLGGNLFEWTLECR